MNIQFNNYNLITKKQNLIWNLLLNFINEQHTNDRINQYNNNLISIHYTHHTTTTINTKTLALLNITKKEIKNIIKQDNIFFYIYNKDFKSIYKKLNSTNHPDLNHLKIFFHTAIKTKTNLITIHKEKDILSL